MIKSRQMTDKQLQRKEANRNRYECQYARIFFKRRGVHLGEVQAARKFGL